MSRAYDNKTPVSIKLGDLKPLLQREAVQKDRSLHYIIIKVLREHCDNKRPAKKK